MKNGTKLMTTDGTTSLRIDQDDTELVNNFCILVPTIIKGTSSKKYVTDYINDDLGKGFQKPRYVYIYKVQIHVGNIFFLCYSMEVYVGF